jgi:hypothetical protein
VTVAFEDDIGWECGSVDGEFGSEAPCVTQAQSPDVDEVEGGVGWEIGTVDGNIGSEAAAGMHAQSPHVDEVGDAVGWEIGSVDGNIGLEAAVTHARSPDSDEVEDEDSLIGNGGVNNMEIDGEWALLVSFSAWCHVC